MRREVILAIAIGFSIGLLLAAGLLLGRKTIRQGIKLPQLGQKQTEESTPSPEPSHAEDLQALQALLEITFPEDESIFNEDEITLEGQTEPEAIISLIYEKGEALGEADEKGHFSFEIPLVGGANEITVTAYSLEGEEKSETITVVYTTAEI